MLEAEQLREVARGFFREIWNEGDESAIDRYIAEDAAGNDPQFGIGRESFRGQWRKWREAFPDIHFALEEVVADPEQQVVVSRWILTGTHRGDFRGVAATGRKISVDGVSIDRIDNGMVVSGFDAWDSRTLFDQLSGTSSP